MSRQADRRVLWVDGTFRKEWNCRYSTAGATMRSVPSANSAAIAAANCWIASRGVPSPPSDTVRLVVATLRKILQRGTAPPIDPRSERIILGKLGLSDAIRGSGPTGDVSPRLATELSAHFTDDPIRHFTGHQEPDPQLAFDSDAERWFLCEWVPTHLGARAVGRVIPQPPLDVLAAGVPQTPPDEDAKRRCDFLLCPPGSRPYVVELDGRQHGTDVAVDKARDAALENAGYDVIRIRAAANPGEREEKRAEEREKLAAIKADWRDAPSSDDPVTDGLVWGAAQVHRLVLALLDAVLFGYLSGPAWRLRVDDPTGLAVCALAPYLDLMLAVDTLWAGDVVPLSVFVETERGSTHFCVDEDGFNATPTDPPATVDLVVRLEPGLTATNLLEANWQHQAEIVVRSTPVPLPLRDRIPGGKRRPPVRNEAEHTEWALTTILRSVFAKESFREGQLDAILEIIRGRDCCVLLPTGAGKSLIYQLVGLCSPGRTLVVDPLVALMEDQVRRLGEDGIDRAATFSGKGTGGGTKTEIEHRIASGDALFIFVSPERLQQASFRSSLRELAQTTPINLAVVDEAHCVSEWGHDFRTAYLNLGQKLRDICEDAAGRPPPLLALTGTASRAVLRDVLIELGIDRESDRGLVRPSSFDRPELELRVCRTSPQGARGALHGALKNAAYELGLASETQLFTPQGDATTSGLVFCPHVNKQWGVGEIAAEIEAMAGVNVPCYAAKAPNGYDAKGWNGEKARNAAAFIANEQPLLVATHAFGMGIDKPNIRHLVHFGMPGSIEAYYQEVGRAGRDGKPAHCTLLLIEDDAKSSRHLLDEDADHQEAHSRFRKRQGDGDVGRQLHFLYGSFPGAADELAVIDSLIAEIRPVGVRASIGIPMTNQSGSQSERERALHRLVVLGVLGRYEVDWGGHRFHAELADIDAEHVIENLVDYVGRSQPGRVELIRQSVSLPAGTPVAEVAHTCAGKLIEFVYDTVERSRRRAVREMWLAANEGVGDEEGRFRARILAYLTHGDIAPKLEALIDREKFGYGEWLELLEDGGLQDDIGELRGTTARLLAAAPDHPGLLLARGFSELLDYKGSLPDSVSNLEASFRSARDRYGAPEDEIVRAVGWLLARADTFREGGGSAIIAAAHRASAAYATTREHERDSLYTGGEAGTLVFALAGALDDALALVSATADNEV